MNRNSAFQTDMFTPLKQTELLHLQSRREQLRQELVQVNQELRKMKQDAIRFPIHGAEGGLFLMLLPSGSVAISDEEQTVFSLIDVDLLAGAIKQIQQRRMHERATSPTDLY